MGERSACGARGTCGDGRVRAVGVSAGGGAGGEAGVVEEMGEEGEGDAAGPVAVGTVRVGVCVCAEVEELDAGDNEDENEDEDEGCCGYCDMSPPPVGRGRISLPR